MAALAPIVDGRQQRHDFPPGMALTEGTIGIMVGLVRAQHTHPRIRRRALEILRDYEVASGDYLGMIAAVYDFVLTHVRYVRDPLGAEYVTEPITLDAMIDDGTAAEDCETLEVYAAALLASIGLQTQFEGQAKRRDQPDTFTHCAMRVRNPAVPEGRDGDWIDFDIVGAVFFADFGVGDTLRKPGERIERWSLEGERQSMRAQLGHYFGRVDGGRDRGYLGECFGDVPDVANIVGGFLDAAKSVAPYLGPVGLITGGVISVGEGIYDAVTGQHLGQALPPKKVTPPKSPTSGGAAVAIPIAALAAWALL